MLTGAVLFIWAGYSTTATTALDHFPTMGECRAAQEAIVKRWDNRVEGDCLPYRYEAEE